MTTGLLDRDALNTKANTGPSTRSVTSNELSSNRMAEMASKDSVMRQRAELTGKNYSTSRGLLDSSIGAQSVFGAFMDRAAPLALQESDRYGQVEDQNLNYQNQFKMADKNFGYQGLLQKDNQTWQTGEREGSQNFTAGENALDRTHQKDMQGNEFTWRAGENAADRTLQKDLQGNEFTWRSGESALDRQQQSTMLDRQQSFAAGENALDRALTREELESRERIAVEQSKAELERLGYALQLDQLQLNASTQNQMQMMLLSQIMQIQSDSNLDPSARQGAIQNAMDAVTNLAKTLSEANKTPVNMPTTSFNVDRASNILVDEAAKLGYTNPNMAELNMALEYARANNLTEQQMRAYVRDKLTAQNTAQSQPSAQQTATPQQTSATAPNNSASANNNQALIDLAAQYGYQATPEEAASVAAYAAANGLTPEQVVMAELRAMGLA